MKNLTALFVCISMIGVVVSQNYCSFTPKHTMCQYKGLGKKCGEEIFQRGVTKQEMTEILKVHNRLRAKLARGEEKRGVPGPQPPAANMRAMEWDDELATVAQRHADQCKFEHDCSKCRKISRFGVGQNLYIYKQSLRPSTPKWEKAIVDWYDEVELFSNKQVEPFKFSAAIGHYSQLVWAETYKIGCGATTYKEGKWFSTLYTCNYGPNGNFIRGQMYKQGRGCSSCPRGTKCSKEFPGLCEAGSSAPVFIPGGSVDNSIPENKPAPSTRPPIVFRPRPSTLPPVTTRRPTTRRPTTRRPTTRRPTTRRPTTRRTTTQRPTTTRRTTTTKAPRRTTKRPVKPPKNTTTSENLFLCDFETELEECDLRSGGTKWKKQTNTFEGVPNTYHATILDSKDQTELFFENLINPPKKGIACLDFKYKKISTGESMPLRVLAWPFKGKPGKVNILRDSPDTKTWIRAQITYRNIDNYFLVMLKSAGPPQRSSRMYLALDDVTIREGECE